MLSKYLKSKHEILVLLGLIIFIGLLLRLNNLGGSPFWKTELYQSWAARRFLEGYNFTLPSGEVFYSRSFLTSTIPITLSFALFGYTEFAARVPSVIYGLMTVLVVYLLGKEVLDKEYGLICGLLLSLSYWSITWSTQARMYSASQFFYIAAVLLIFIWYKSGFELNNNLIFLLLPLLALGYHNHLLFIGILPVLTTIVLISMYRDYLHGKLYEDEFIRKSRILVAILMSLIIYASIFGLPAWFFGYTPSWYDAERGVLFYLDWLNNYMPYMFLASAGALIALFKKDYWIIIISFVLPFVMQSVLFEFKEPRFIYHLYPLILMNVGVVFHISYSIIKEKISISDIWSLIIVMGMVIIIQNPIGTFDKVNQNSHGLIGEQPNHRGPANHINDRLDKNDIIISTEPMKTTWYMENNVDYDLNPLNSVNQSGKIIDEETGVEIVESVEALDRIMDSGSGWIIVSEKNLGQKTPEKLENHLVSKNLKSIEKHEWHDTRILRFESD